MKRNLPFLALFAATLLVGYYVYQLAQQHNGVTPLTEQGLSDTQLLGKRLFEDTSLSEPRGLACVSCHEPNKAFSGNNHSSVDAVSLGSDPKKFGERNAPTIAYAALIPPFTFFMDKDEDGKESLKPKGGLMMDGKRASLMKQPEQPLLNPIEMNNPSKKAVVDKVAAGKSAELMKQIFGDNIFDNTNEAFDDISIALASFESSPRFMPFNSKFDMYLQGKDKLTEQELRGFALFKDPKKGNCIACHVGKEDSTDPHDWEFTDYTYDNVGVPRNKAIPRTFDETYYDLGLCARDDLAAVAPKDYDVKSLCGAFRVPTLRNIALTAPYGHNGYFKNLRQVVKFYATRDTDPAAWYPKNKDGQVAKFNDLPDMYDKNVNTDEVPYNRKLGEAPALNDTEVDDIVAFLNTLTDKPAK